MASGTLVSTRQTVVDVGDSSSLWAARLASGIPGLRVTDPTVKVIASTTLRFGTEGAGCNAAVSTLKKLN